MPLTDRDDLPRFDAVRLGALLASMHAAADLARSVTVPRFRVPPHAPLSIDDKASGQGFDPVTDADREAEALVREHLLDAHPEIGFLGEESASHGATSGPRWVVDPIDGTRAFITGMPLWGTLIALNDGQDVVLGLLDQPILGERYVGGADGAFLHAAGSVRPLRTRRDRALADASLCCTTPDMFAPGAERAAFDRVAMRAKLVRYGGDCYAYAQLAAGYVDLVIESDLKPWDVQALIPIVRGAGGTVTDWSGNGAGEGGCIVAAGSADLHAEALSHLRDAPR